jgi:hypothetical protein
MRMSVARRARTWLDHAVDLAPVVAGVVVADWLLMGMAHALDLRMAFHERDASWYPWYLAIVAVVVVAGLVACAGPRVSKPLRLAVGLTLGGALGNMSELAAFGHVTDFIPFPPSWLASAADVCMFAAAAIVCFEAVKGVGHTLAAEAGE